MSALPWSDHENDAIVADYFAMLLDDLARRRVNKSDHRRALLDRLNGRNDSAIEFKHCNISAAAKGFGLPVLTGYLPRYNRQASLEDAIARWLSAHDNAFLPAAPAPGFADGDGIALGVAPTLQNAPEPAETTLMTAIAHKFDVAGRDARNRALGRAGEARVVAHEKSVLVRAGRPDLARRVHWTADVDGDGAGFDIRSFTPEGGDRLVEVKTTTGWDRTPFHLSARELDVANDRRDAWVLFRLWDFARAPKAFELYPPLDRHVSLTATDFRASFH